MASIFEKVSEKSKKNTATLFKDLNKPTKDLFEKGFKTDIYEVETETTTPNGIKLKKKLLHQRKVMEFLEVLKVQVIHGKIGD